MTGLRYLDVCAGISASSVAWKPLGWEAAAYSEIEAAPRAVLEHRQGALPVGWDHLHVAGSNTTPLFGDFTQIEAHHVGPIDLLVGGTPCQDFSISGLRAGLDGDRGNLSLEFLRLADRTRPRWVVWENVPGVLSIDEGRAFGAILGGMGELGYGAAYRVLDAVHFGSASFRRRVFIVGYLGDWRPSAAALVERQSMSGHSSTVRGRLRGIGKDRLGCLSAKGAAYDRQDLDVLIYDYDNLTVRRPTVLECERAMGFPDDYTLVPHRGKPMADGPRYKALGNSMAVPVMRWIGERIDAVEALQYEKRDAA